ncbi:MAG TPA: hypothetical protein VGL58_17600 [Caulobacteraceae bacterium]|jgi:hypothetical protein
MTPYQIYAVMVLCARDVDVIWHVLDAAGNQGGNPALPPAGTPGLGYVTAASFDALAQLRCDDTIISKGNNVYYGLVLRCHTATAPFVPGDYLVAVRGTMDTEEWFNDALALLPRNSPRGPGQVGEGFWDIYDTMTLNDLAGGGAQANVAPAIAAMVAARPGKVWVVGHSLGAALATYLAADLQPALKAAAPAVEMDPYFFASPKTGTGDYVANYQRTIATYSLVNYAVDVVPMVPPDLLGYSALNGGGPSHDVHIISYPTAGGLPNSLANNHSPVGYARMLDPANAIAAALPAP